MDWKTLISEAREHGMTQKEIGDAIGLSQPSIVDVLNGNTKELKWGNGQRLIALHKSLTKPRKKVA